MAGHSDLTRSIDGRRIGPLGRSLPLVAIVCLSAALNLGNIRYGLPYVYGRNVEGRIVEIAVNAFATGDMNPHTAIYPHLHLYVLLSAFLPYYLWGRLTGSLASSADLLTAFQADPTPLYAISRSVTALFGAGCVLLAYLICRRLFRQKAPLAAPLLLASSPLLVTQAHLVSPDVMLTFFVLASFFYAQRILAHGRSRDYLMAGAMLGLAFTAKYPAAIAAVFILVAHGLRRHPTTPDENHTGRWSALLTGLSLAGGILLIALALLPNLAPIITPLRRVLHARADTIEKGIRAVSLMGGALIALLPYLIRKIPLFQRLLGRHRGPAVSLAGFVIVSFIGSPYLVLDISETLNSLIYHAMTESKPFWGYEELPVGWIYYLGVLREGTSLPFTVLFLAGSLFLIFRHDPEDILLLSFPATYYLFIGSFETTIPRYILPILPFLAIIGASPAHALSGILGERTRAGLAAIPTVAISLAAIPSLAASLEWDLLTGKTDTRTLAKEWIETHIPRGSRIAIDSLGPPLSDSDYRLFVAFRGELRPIPDPWGHYRLGEIKELGCLLEEGIEYAVVNSHAYGNYRRVPHLYPDEHAFYRDLEAGGELLRTFQPEGRPGPEIKVYFLSHRGTAPPGAGSGGRPSPGA